MLLVLCRKIGCCLVFLRLVVGLMMPSKPRRELCESLIASLRDAVWETEDAASAISRLYELVWFIEDEQTQNDIQMLAGRLHAACSTIMDYSTRIDFLLTPLEIDEAGSDAE